MEMDRILDLFFVPKCAGCGERMLHRKTLMCETCRERYLDAKEEFCDFCGLSAPFCTCVPALLIVQGCSDYRKIAFYKTGGEMNAFRNMIYSVKKKYNLPLMQMFMHELSALGADGLRDPIVTYIPRSRRAKRAYGYDQGKLLAKFFAREMGFAFKPLFRRALFHRKKEQKLLNFQQRASNTRGAYRLKHEKMVLGRDVIIVDDVVTSGATVGECAGMLYSAGAETVAVRSIAYTYRKNKKKSD